MPLLKTEPSPDEIRKLLAEDTGRPMSPDDYSPDEVRSLLAEDVSRQEQPPMGIEPPPERDVSETQYHALGAAKHSLWQGIRAVGAGLPGVVGRIIPGEDPVEKIAQENRAFYDKIIGDDPDIRKYVESIQKGSESFATEVLGNVGPTAAGLAMAFIPFAGPVLSTGMFYDLNTEEIENLARQKGADEESVKKMGIVGGLINTALDMTGIFRMRKIFKPADKLTNFLVGLAVTSGIEGGTEGFQGVIGEITSDWAAKPESESTKQFIQKIWGKKDELLETFLHDASIGAAIGGGIHTIAAGVRQPFEPAKEPLQRDVDPTADISGQLDGARQAVLSNFKQNLQQGTMTLDQAPTILKTPIARQLGLTIDDFYQAFVEHQSDKLESVMRGEAAPIEIEPVEPTGIVEPEKAVPTMPKPEEVAPGVVEPIEEGEIEVKKGEVYPTIKDNTVDGRIVSKDVPNTSSIQASLTDYEELPGIREISMSDIETTDPKDLFYAADDRKIVRELAEKIKESGEISPLIVVQDKDGLYILEGGHRLGALHELGAKSFPALVVKDLAPDVVPEAVKEPTAPEVKKPAEVEAAQIDTLIEQYEATGRVASRYPKKKQVSVDGRTMTEKAAIAKMKRVIAEKPAEVEKGVEEVPELPEGWKAEVGRTRVKEGHTAEAEVDWKGKRIVFSEQKHMDNPEIANHEIAHVFIETLPENKRESLLDEYVKTAEVSEWEVKNQFHREKIAIDYGNYLTNPDNVDQKLRTVFDKYTKKPPDIPEPQEGKPTKEGEKVLAEEKQVAQNRERANKAKSFRMWVKWSGGIHPQDKTWKGEISDIFGKKGARKAPVGMFKKSALGVDELTQKAIEDGWLPKGSTDDDFIRLLETDSNRKITDESLDELIQKEIDFYKAQELEAGRSEDDIRETEEAGIQEANEEADERIRELEKLRDKPFELTPGGITEDDKYALGVGRDEPLLWDKPPTPPMPTEEEPRSAIDLLKDEKGFLSLDALQKSPAYDGVLTTAKDVINQGHTTLEQFTTRMKEVFAETWDKIKAVMKDLYATAKKILKSEVGAITIEGKPAQDLDQWAKDYLQTFMGAKPEAMTPDAGEKKHGFRETLEPITDEDYIEARKDRRNLRLSTKNNVRRVFAEIAEGVDKYMGSISTRLGQVSKKLKAKLRRLDFDIGTQHTRDVKRVEPLLRKALKMSKDDFADWDYARKNSGIEKIHELIEKYDMQTEYDEYRQTLNDLRAEGLDVGLEIGLIEEYAPRALKDSRGFLTAIGKAPEWPIYTRRLEERARDLGFLSVEEIPLDMRAEIISNMILGGWTGLGGVSATKERKLKKVPAYLNQYYMDSDSALMKHLYDMRKLIEGAKFFGKIPQKVAEIRKRLYAVQKKIREANKELKGDLSKELSEQIRNRRNKNIGLEKQYTEYINKYATQRDYKANIGTYVSELITNKEIEPKHERIVNEILNARFHERGTRGVVQAYKNISYMDTMGSPVSALTQIGDLAWAYYNSGFLLATKHAYRALTGKQRITKEAVGITRIAQEFADSGTLGNAVTKVFKWVGLEKIDSIGKEALLNSALEKHQKQAKKNPAKLKKELRGIFENETDGVIEDLASGTITDNVKLLVYSRLLDFQPVALSEMPQKYLDAGNGRLFYMLKTFTLKVFDVYRNEIYYKVTKGNKAEKIQGMKNLVTLTMFFVLANAGADELKDWLLGRKTDFSDRVTDNILRLFGISKFVTWKARTEGVGSALARQILPPFKFIDSAGKDIINAGDEKGLEMLGSIPLIGKLAYWHLGRGTRKREDLWNRRLRKEKSRLNKVKKKLQTSEDKEQFRKDNRDKLLRLRSINRLQGRLNKYQKRINRLKSLPETKERKIRIQSLEKARTELIKTFLKQ